MGVWMASPFHRWCRMRPWHSNSRTAWVTPMATPWRQLPPPPHPRRTRRTTSRRRIWSSTTCPRIWAKRRSGPCSAVWARSKAASLSGTSSLVSGVFACRTFETVLTNKNYLFLIELKIPYFLNWKNECFRMIKKCLLELEIRYLKEFTAVRLYLRW